MCEHSGEISRDLAIGLDLIDDLAWSFQNDIAIVWN